MILPAFDDTMLRGDLTPNAPLGAQSWFRCGGLADLLFEPADRADLQNFLKQYPEGEPLTILGGMANTIIRDSGVRGVVIRLGKVFSEISVKDGTVTVGAGALNGSVAAAAMKAGLGELEFLSGIPGMVGGALRMNAGAYGREMKDVLVNVQALNRNGEEVVLTLNQMNMTYRHTEIPEGTIFTAATLTGKEEGYETVKARMNDIKFARNETQPIREKTGGSTFANPSEAELLRAGLEGGLRAWQLVERVGGRGLEIGGAQMSEKHCNFMINTGDATAHDLEALGDEIIQRVFDDCGLTLRWEIQRIGDV